MKTFKELLYSVCPSGDCRFLVEYPNKFIRSQLMEINKDIDWVDETKCEGVCVLISSDIYYRAEYKCGEWVLAGR